MSRHMYDPDPPASPSGPALRELTVPVTPLDARGRSGRSATVAAVLVVGALGLALVSGALFPGAPIPSPIPSGVAAVTASPAVASPSTSAAPSGPVAGWLSGLAVLRLDSWPFFVDWVRSTSLDGTVVLLELRSFKVLLSVVRVSCADGQGTCPVLSIPGLDLPIVAAPELLPWDSDPNPGATLVLVAGGGKLTYIGSLPTDVTAPVSITTLLENPNRFLTLNDLYPVEGELVAADPGSCGTTATAFDLPPGCGLGRFLANLDVSGMAMAVPPQGAPVAATGTIIGMARGLPPETTVGTYLVRRMYRPACASASPSRGVRCDQQFVIQPQVVAFVTVDTALRVTAPSDVLSIVTP